MATADSVASVHTGQRLRPRRGIQIREAAIKASLSLCGLFSIATTLTIIVVLTMEAITFFRMDEVSLVEFFTTSQWNPLLGAEKHFGIWSLISGTMLVTGVAMEVDGGGVLNLLSVVDNRHRAALLAQAHRRYDQRFLTATA